MSENHKESSRLRWLNTTAEERKAVGKKHRAALVAYWKTVDPKARAERGRVAARARWGKKKPQVGNSK